MSKCGGNYVNFFKEEYIFIYTCVCVLSINLGPSSKLTVQRKPLGMSSGGGLAAR